MTLRRLLKQKPALLAGALLMVAGAATLYFPETWYPEETQWQLATEKDIPGIQGGLSGLTWNPDSGTLFAVTDHPSSVVELDTDGNVLRVIPSDGDHDFEAIEYLAYSALFDHGLASKSDQRFASIRSTGNLTFSTAF
ncbi:hypothetical protein FXQ52_08750 [Salmonella enterica]|nr:hypothetical protein [Salmonella enterica]